jgi:hypothetical protein
MPQSTPAGGLSLIIHILINIVIFAYNKAVKLLKLPKKNFVSKSFSTLTNKKGDTIARRFLSYLLVCLVFLIMGGNFLLITVRLFKLEDVRITTKIEDIIARKYPSAVNTSISSEQSLQSLNYSPLEYAETEVQMQTPLIQKAAEGQYATLVDFMESLGIVNTSFEARAELAVQSGVISDISEYTGSLSQNREIIKKLQEELQVYVLE